MRKINAFYETVDHIITSGVQEQILHLSTDDAEIEGSLLRMDGRPVVNFGSCSYLGLEFDPRLKAAATEAIQRYGTQFAESRAYVSISLYRELEAYFEQIFGAPSVVVPTTTLGHIGAIPVLVGTGDAVILDHQVHNSVQTAVEIVKARGGHVEIMRHNNMEMLEERIKVLRQKHRRIWYMADGIYSMFGDKSPVKKVNELMDKYNELWYYVDDAHGMSIYGKNGSGYVLSEAAFHPKMILVTSLAKAFATGGAVMVFPSRELARQVRTCASTLITSGPMQPGNLGAAIASAKIHLSEEIYQLQGQLQDNIRYTNLLLKKFDLPLISTSDAAVFYIGVALPKIGYSMVKRMLRRGFYLNLGIFPAVPIKNTGIRFTITRMHSFRQIEEMVTALAEELEAALTENQYSLPQIYKDFKLPTRQEIRLNLSYTSLINQSLRLEVHESDTIRNMDKAAWDKIFRHRGTFDWAGLALLEDSFSGNAEPENCWKFRYILVKDHAGSVVLATFLTAAIVKDDMLAPAEVSAEIEYRRKDQPDYLTSRTIVMGSLLTEGEHLFLDPEHPLRNDAFLLFMSRLTQFQDQTGATKIILRDFAGVDPGLDNLLVSNGFFRTAMPDNNIIRELSWNGEGDFYRQLSVNARKNFRKFVAPNQDRFTISLAQAPSDQEIAGWYQLYLNVKNRSFRLNTFALPLKLFQLISRHQDWEVLVLSENTSGETVVNNGPATCEKPVGVVFCHRAGDAYIPMIIGLDYACNARMQTYRQALYQVVRRAGELQKKKVLLGFSAETEKRKVGAVQVATYAYMQVRDNFDLQVVAANHKSVQSVRVPRTVE